MTYRTVTAWGLIAGASLTEMQNMLPGVVLDLFIIHRAYDMSMRGHELPT